MQFEFALFSKLAKLLGFKRHQTTTYHPQSKGMLEHWHPMVKSAIMVHDGSSWSHVLRFILLGLRAVACEEFVASATDLLYGENL